MLIWTIFLTKWISLYSGDQGPRTMVLVFNPPRSPRLCILTSFISSHIFCIMCWNMEVYLYTKVYSDMAFYSLMKMYILLSSIHHQCTNCVRSRRCTVLLTIAFCNQFHKKGSKNMKQLGFDANFIFLSVKILTKKYSEESTPFKWQIKIKW